MNHHGYNYDPSAASGYQQPQQPHWQQQQQHAGAAPAAMQPYVATSSSPEYHQHITSPTLRDVLNGRGQGVQRHPGNIKYRTLVFVNKGLYAKCPRTDKVKISKGIVAAVRELGGRFLELDERTGIYNDIGDKKATEKTSQALREGQTKIRKQMYKEEESGPVGSITPTYDTSMLDPNNPRREISAEGYFGYSVQVLQSLYDAEDGDAAAAPNGGAIEPPAASGPPPLPAPVVVPKQQQHLPAAMAMALDQFPGAVLAAEAPSAPAPYAQTTMPPPLPQQPSTVNQAQGTCEPSFWSERFTSEFAGRPSLSRLTGMSLASILSVYSYRQLMDNPHDINGPDGFRGSIESVASEIQDLIGMSEPQLMQVENNGMKLEDESNGNGSKSGNGSNGGGNDRMAMTHEDREVALFPDEADIMKGEDRVSELRFTDVTRDIKAYGYGGDPNPRLTDSTESTSYSKTSLMDASMMTIPTEDMSVLDGGRHSTQRPATASGRNDDGDLASAELLLRLSNDNNHANGN